MHKLAREAPTPDVMTRRGKQAREVPSEWWGRERFFNADGSQSKCPVVIDLTGPARFLVYGPYAPVAAGLWRATVSFELCGDGARRFLLVQFGSDPDYTTVGVAPTRQPGRRDVAVEHRVKAGGLAQVRVYLARAAFHGDFRFIGVKAQRLGAS